MIIKSNKKDLFRTDNQGLMILNTFNRDLTYATFDIEYDGFFPGNSILSFSATKYRTSNDKVVDEISFIAEPYIPLHPHVEKITGFTNEHLKENGINQIEAINRIKSFMDDVDAIIGYNIKADKDFLVYRIPQLENVIWFDVLDMLRDFLPNKELKSFNPQLVLELFSVSYREIGYTHSVNQIFQIMLEQYAQHFEYDQPKKLPTPKIWKLYYKVEKTKPRRLYINTNMGQFYFDFSQQVYGLRSSQKISSVCEVDMEGLRLKLLKHFKLKNEMELYFHFAHKSEYAVELNNSL